MASRESHVKQAAQVFAALKSLDPDEVERAELCSNGVRESIIRRLYPLALEAIAPALLNHLREHPVKQDAVSPSELAKRREAARTIRWALSTEQWNRLQDEAPVVRRGVSSLALVTEHVHERIGGASTEIDFGTVLWTAWWAAANRHKLDDNLLEHTDELMWWIGKNFLPNLVGADA